MPTLYVVATPIGNLEDVSLRALRTLREVKLIAAEDTRKTKRLLTTYDIKTPMTSYHKHNEWTKLDYILGYLEGGDVALVSEAGTPGMSDPGYELIVAASQRGIPVVPIPGPSAVITALTISGLATERFTYLGFLPRRVNSRRRLLETVVNEYGTIVVLESPHRLLATLNDTLLILGDRRIAVGRELTKIHEECRLGRLSRILQELPQTIRGELTLVVQGPEDDRPGKQVPCEEDLLREIDSSPGRSTGQAVREVARRHGLSSREAYKLWVRKGGKGRSSRKSPKK